MVTVPIRRAALAVSLLLGCAAGLTAAPGPLGSIRGVVRDAAGGAVSGAAVAAAAANGVLLASASSGEDGTFRLAVPHGRHELAVTAAGFRPWRSAVDVSTLPLSIDVVLDVATHDERVTVSASRGLVDDLDRQPQSLNVIGADRLWERSPTVLAQVVQGEPGLAVQRTSPTMAGVFVRGLTGSKVNVYVDGVRFSTGAARGGVNTFLSLVSPSFLDRVEVLRGPASAQYGSDAIGGSVQVLTRAPVFGEAVGRRWRGEIGTWGGTADWSAGTSATLSYAGTRGGIVAGVNGLRASTLRPGGGYDSHAAVTRFLGLSSTRVSGERVPDSAFTQYGGFLRAQYATAPSSHVVAYYARSQQDGGRRTDQLLGGDGNLVADLRNLMTNFGYVRYSRLDAGWLDRFTLTASVNTQREERVNQGGNGNPRALVTHEYERTTALGLQLEAGRRLGDRQEIAAGAEYSPERVAAPSFGFDQVTGTSAARRGRVPDGARFRTAAVWLQHQASLTSAVRVDSSVRYTSARYRADASESPLVGGLPLWPDDHVSAGSFSFRTGATWAVAPRWIVAANVGRGFRAPHVTDLGTLGLTGSGFEVAAADLAGRGATIGTSAGSDAIATGRPVVQIAPETSLSYEGALRYEGGRLRASVTGFVNTIYDAITRQALILPQGAVGSTLGGQPIVAQGASGLVYVPLSTAPVLARANYGNARLRGLEAFAEWRPSPRWVVGVAGTAIRAADLDTGAPPNIEGGTPAPSLHARVLYSFSDRAWVEPSLEAAARQRRLSSLDLEDRRTGGFRSRATIRNFFTRGATVRGWIAPGIDGILGTADDVLAATGETLAEVQDRVLGPGVAGAPLLQSVEPYVVVNLRAGMRLSRSLEVGADLLNVGDANYRGISSGIDAPGRSVVLRVKRTF